MKKADKNAIDVFLANCNRPAGRNLVENNQPLIDAVEYFLDLKKNNDPSVDGITLNWFYNKHLKKRFDGPKSATTVLKFVRDVLKRDADNGKAIE